MVPSTSSLALNWSTVSINVISLLSGILLSLQRFHYRWNNLIFGLMTLGLFKIFVLRIIWNIVIWSCVLLVHLLCNRSSIARHLILIWNSIIGRIKLFSNNPVIILRWNAKVCSQSLERWWALIRWGWSTLTIEYMFRPIFIK